MSSNFQTSSEDSSANSIESSQNDVSPSASEDRGPTDSIPRSGLETPMALARLSGSNSQLPNFQPHQLAALFHLSLIEGRCRTQAAIALNAGRRLDDHLPENHPEVHRLAKHLFSEMTKELHKAGILPDEFAGQELSELRRNYLSSFDAILHNIASQRTHGFQDNTYSSLFDRSKAYAIGGELLSTSLIDKRAFVLQQYTMAPQNHIPSLPALSFKAIYKTDVSSA
jgi:translation initiation factor 2-alpha kinase 3